MPLRRRRRRRARRAPGHATLRPPRERDAAGGRRRAHADRVRARRRAARAAGVRARPRPRASPREPPPRPRQRRRDASLASLGRAARSCRSRRRAGRRAPPQCHARARRRSPASRPLLRQVDRGRVGPPREPGGAGDGSRPSSTGSPPGRRRCRRPWPTSSPRLASAREAVVQVAALDRELVAIRSRVLAARSADDLATELAAAQRDLAAATQTRLLAREALVEIREQRLDGMAAEIAARARRRRLLPGVRLGRPPRPGVARVRRTRTRPTEREARRGSTTLEVVVEAHAQQVRGLETRLAAAARRGRRGARHAPRRRGRHAGPPRRCPGRRGHGRRRWPPGSTPCSASRTTASGSATSSPRPPSRLDTEAAVLDARLDALRQRPRASCPTAPTSPTLTAHHQQVAGVARRCTDTAADLARARESAAEHPSGPPTARRPRRGFPTSEAAAAAVAPRGRLTALVAAVERHERGRRAPTSCSPTPPSSRPRQRGRPTSTCSPRPAAAPRRRRDDAPPRPGPARARGPAPRPDRRRSRAALAAWAPVRADLDLVAELAAFVEGKSADNRCRCGCPPTSWPTGSPRSSRRQRAAGHDERPALLPGAHRAAGRRRDPRRPQPAGPRRLDRRHPRPGHAVGRRDLRGLARAGPRPRRRRSPRRRAAPTSTRSSSTRGSARSTPTPSTT